MDLKDIQSKYLQTPEKKPTKTTGVVGLEDIQKKYTQPPKPTTKEKISTAPSFLEDVGANILRKTNLLNKALIGDVPFLGKTLRPEVQEMEPQSMGEKALSGVSRFARDVGAFQVTGNMMSGLSKLPLLSKIGWIAKGGLRAKTAQSAGQGIMYGAATAGSEDPKEIAKSAGKMGAIFGAIPPAMGALGKALPAAGRALGKVPIAKGKKLKDVADAVGKWTGFKITESSAKNLMRARYFEIGAANRDTAVFVNNLKKITTPRQRKILPFLIEGQMPKGMARDVTRKEYYKTLKPVAKKIGHYLDDAHQFMVDNYGKDVGFIKDYIPHIWDIPKSKTRQVMNWFVTKNPQTKRRLIPTLKEGIDKFGLKPRYDDVADMIKAYDQIKTKSIANIRFVKGLTRLKDREGTALIQRMDKAPQDWVTMDYPALRRGMGKMFKDKGVEKLMLNKVPVKVHPSIVDIVKTSLDRPFNDALSQGVTRLNATAKFMNLTFSLFHHTALTEAAIANNTFSPSRIVGIMKAVKKGKYNSKVFKDPIKHQLELGGIPDVQRNVLENMLKGIETKLTKNKSVISKLAGKAFKAPRKAVEVWNKGLWDYYHTALKVSAYEKLTAQGLKKYSKGMPFISFPGGGVMRSETAIKREVAQFVNDTFGGQAWDMLLRSPKFRQAAHWAMLSPDWTLSTLRQAAAPTGGGALYSITKEMRKEFGQDFWRRGALIFYGGMNLLNKAFTEAEYGKGKGRYMWDNPEGHKTYLFMERPEGQPENYLRFGKQFRELPEYFMNPGKKFGGKISPIMRYIRNTSMPSPIWQQDLYGKGYRDPQWWKGMAKETGKAFLPYSFQSMARQHTKYPITMAMPVSKGVTFYEAKQQIRRAVESGDKNRFRKVMRDALQNNQPAIEILDSVERTIKGERTKKASRTARDLADRLFMMTPEQQAKYIELKRKRGVITDKVEEEMKDYIKQKNRVKKQRKELNIP